MWYIRWCPLDLKLVKSFDLFSQKTWLLCKGKCFRHKMWLRVLSYSIYKNWNIVTCFFISIRLISIFSMKSVEELTSHTCQSRNWLFPSFSCLKSWYLVLIRHVTGRFVYVPTILLTQLFYQAANERWSLKIGVSNFPKYNENLLKNFSKVLEKWPCDIA